jgi:hypothetical protein
VELTQTFITSKIKSEFADFSEFFRKTEANEVRKMANEPKTQNAPQTVPEVKNVEQKSPEIRIRLFYEKNSSKDTAYVYGEGVEASPEQARAIGVDHLPVPNPVIRSLYLPKAELSRRFGINQPLKGFEVVLIPL